MDRRQPPTDAANLIHHTLAGGSLLWRIPRSAQLQEGSLFNSKRAPIDVVTEVARPEEPYGRFDATAEDGYDFLYAALDDLTSIAEVLLRDVAFPESIRALPYKEVRGRCLAVYETLEPLQLVSLTTSAELARAWQDPWLIQAAPGEYALTRRWGHWLRRCSSEAQGFLWPSKRNPGGHCLILFGDRGAAAALSTNPVFQRDLDGSTGLAWLNRRLETLNTVVDDPYAPPDAAPHLPSARRAMGS